MGTLLYNDGSKWWMNYLQNEIGKQVGAKNVKSWFGKCSQYPRLPGATAVSYTFELNSAELDLPLKRMENDHFERSPTYPILALQ